MRWSRKRTEQECMTWAALLIACIVLCVAMVAAVVSRKIEAFGPAAIMFVLCFTGWRRKNKELEDYGHRD